MTSPQRRTLIVLPAFNEEASVGSVVAEVITKIPGATVLVIDDGSHDNTAIVAEKAGALVARLPFNLGVGGAMRTGFRFAMDNKFDVVVQIDADGQHDPASAAMIMDALGDIAHPDADLVVGARFAGEGDYLVRGPRKWAMTFLAFVLSHAADTPLTDTTSGYRAFGPRAVALFAEHYPAEYLGDTIEALVIALKSGLVIRQVPTSMRVRAGGSPTHGPFRSALLLGRAMLALLFAFLRPKSTYLERVTP